MPTVGTAKDRTLPRIAATKARPANDSGRKSTRAKSAPVRLFCAPLLNAPLPPNAAELWAASLPSQSELAIHAERVARSERQLIPVVHLPQAVDLEQDLTVRPSYGWGLASVAFMAAVVLICAWQTGLLHHLL